MWLYAFVVDHPREHCRRSVRGVADEALGCDLEAFLDPIYHRLSGLNFGCAMSRCCLHVQDHAVLSVHQIVSRVGIKRRAAWRRCPA